MHQNCWPCRCKHSKTFWRLKVKALSARRPRPRLLTPLRPPLLTRHLIQIQIPVTHHQVAVVAVVAVAAAAAGRVGPATARDLQPAAAARIPERFAGVAKLNVGVALLALTALEGVQEGQLGAKVRDEVLPERRLAGVVDREVETPEA